MTTQHFYGVYPAVVTDVHDPAGEGRIRVSFPHLGSTQRSAWAALATPMAGNDRGVWLVPEVGDEAVVSFEFGDASRPVILGFRWNGVDRAPSTAVRERLIRSVNGHTIRFLDASPTSGGNTGGIVIEDASGNQIVMTNGKVTVRSVGILELEGATVVINSMGLRRVVSPTPNPI